MTCTLHPDTMLDQKLDSGKCSKHNSTTIHGSSMLGSKGDAKHSSNSDEILPCKTAAMNTTAAIRSII